MHLSDSMTEYPFYARVRQTTTALGSLHIKKGTEVPNPRRSSTCDCTWALTWIDHCLATLSCLPCALFCSCLFKVRSRISDVLSQALCNLSSFPSWFHAIWFSHTFHSFLKLCSAFRLDRKTWSQRSHVFNLTGTAVLHCGHTFVGGRFTANGPQSNSQWTSLCR